MRARLCCLAVLAGVIAAASGQQPAQAQDVNRVVRTLNAILNPQDARRYEYRAHRSGQPEEERYWRDYRVGLEDQRRERRERQVWSDRSRRFEEQAHRNHREPEERYWHDYRSGLGERER